MVWGAIWSNGQSELVEREGNKLSYFHLAIQHTFLSYLNCHITVLVKYYISKDIKYKNPSFHKSGKFANLLMHNEHITSSDAHFTLKDAYNQIKLALEFCLQVKPLDRNILCQESGKDPVISTVMRYVCKGWPPKHTETNDEVKKFQKLLDSLSIYHGCLNHGSKVVIPQSLQSNMLDLMHIGHLGMEHLKQLARTAAYWPGTEAAIEMASRQCDSCGEHQIKPPKPAVPPWMLPDKPWSHLHMDHAINFMGTKLVITDAF
eukprot:XP_014770226.1 PREDICTED: uncharacterized protein K02A2.6-like [Octopus bimaculoides]